MSSPPEPGSAGIEYTRPVLSDDGALLHVVAAEPTAPSTTFLLVHGWGADNTVWDMVAPALVQGGYGVVRYDQRGHGQSTQGTNQITIDQLGDDLRTVIQTLDLQQVVLVGHSGGGYAALSYLTCERPAHSEVVEAVVLLATASHGQKIVLPERKLMATKLLSRVASRPSLGARVLAHTVAPDVEEAVLDTVRTLFARTPHRVRGATFASTTHMDLRPGLGAVIQPVAVLFGDSDRVIDATFGQQLAAALPLGSFDVVTNAGHMLPLEAPNAVLSAAIAASRPFPIRQSTPTNTD